MPVEPDQRTLVERDITLRDAVRGVLEPTHACTALLQPVDVAEERMQRLQRPKRQVFSPEHPPAHAASEPADTVNASDHSGTWALRGGLPYEVRARKQRAEQALPPAVHESLVRVRNGKARERIIDVSERRAHPDPPARPPLPDAAPELAAALVESKGRYVPRPKDPRLQHDSDATAPDIAALLAVYDPSAAHEQLVAAERDASHDFERRRAKILKELYDGIEPGAQQQHDASAEADDGRVVVFRDPRKAAQDAVAFAEATKQRFANVREEEVPGQFDKDAQDMCSDALIEAIGGILRPEDIMGGPDGLAPGGDGDDPASPHNGDGALGARRFASNLAEIRDSVEYVQRVQLGQRRKSRRYSFVETDEGPIEDLDADELAETIRPRKHSIMSSQSDNSANGGRKWRMLRGMVNGPAALAANAAARMQVKVGRTNAAKVAEAKAEQERMERLRQSNLQQMKAAVTSGQYSQKDNPARTALISHLKKAVIEEQKKAQARFVAAPKRFEDVFEHVYKNRVLPTAGLLSHAQASNILAAADSPTRDSLAPRRNSAPDAIATRDTDARPASANIERTTSIVAALAATEKSKRVVLERTMIGRGTNIFLVQEQPDPAEPMVELFLANRSVATTRQHVLLNFAACEHVITEPVGGAQLVDSTKLMVSLKPADKLLVAILTRDPMYQSWKRVITGELVAQAQRDKLAKQAIPVPERRQTLGRRQSQIELVPDRGLLSPQEDNASRRTAVTGTPGQRSTSRSDAPSRSEHSSSLGNRTPTSMGSEAGADSRAGTPRTTTDKPATKNEKAINDMRNALKKHNKRQAFVRSMNEAIAQSPQESPQVAEIPIPISRGGGIMAVGDKTPQSNVSSRGASRQDKAGTSRRRDSFESDADRHDFHETGYERSTYKQSVSSRSEAGGGTASPKKPTASPGPRPLDDDERDSFAGFAPSGPGGPTVERKNVLALRRAEAERLAALALGPGGSATDDGAVASGPTSPVAAPAKKASKKALKRQPSEKKPKKGGGKKGTTGEASIERKPSAANLSRAPSNVSGGQVSRTSSRATINRTESGLGTSARGRVIAVDDDDGGELFSNNPSPTGPAAANSKRAFFAPPPTDGPPSESDNGRRGSADARAQLLAESSPPLHGILKQQSSPTTTGDAVRAGGGESPPGDDGDDGAGFSWGGPKPNLASGTVQRHVKITPTDEAPAPAPAEKSRLKRTASAVRKKVVAATAMKGAPLDRKQSMLQRSRSNSSLRPSGVGSNKGDMSSSAVMSSSNGRLTDRTSPSASRRGSVQLPPDGPFTPGQGKPRRGSRSSGGGVTPRDGAVLAATDGLDESDPGSFSIILTAAQRPTGDETPRRASAATEEGGSTSRAHTPGGTSVPSSRRTSMQASLRRSRRRGSAKDGDTKDGEESAEEANEHSEDAAEGSHRGAASRSHSGSSAAAAEGGGDLSLFEMRRSQRSDGNGDAEDAGDGDAGEGASVLEKRHSTVSGGTPRSDTDPLFPKLERSASVASHFSTASGVASASGRKGNKSGNSRFKSLVESQRDKEGIKYVVATRESKAAAVKAMVERMRKRASDVLAAKKAKDEKKSGDRPSVQTVEAPGAPDGFDNDPDGYVGDVQQVFDDVVAELEKTRDDVESRMLLKEHEDLTRDLQRALDALKNAPRDTAHQQAEVKESLVYAAWQLQNRRELLLEKIIAMIERKQGRRGFMQSYLDDTVYASADDRNEFCGPRRVHGAVTMDRGRLMRQPAHVAALRPSGATSLPPTVRGGAIDSKKAEQAALLPPKPPALTARERYRRLRPAPLV